MVGAVRPVRVAALMWWRHAYRWMYRTGRTPWDTGVTPPEVVELIEGPAALAPGVSGTVDAGEHNELTVG